jgi:glycerol-3-phosphate O-acyltransferase / dihydroxyacetone phosphate acyltransferase
MVQQSALPLFRRALKRFVQLVAAIFYRKIDVVSDRPLAARGAMLLAVNHTNGLADSLVVIAKAPGFPHFLAAASWWKYAPARLLFRLGGVLPVHRQRAGEDPSQNVAGFEECHRALAVGAQIAIHPEGDMHQGPSLLPLKTGAARIALGAVRDAGVDDLVVVPHAIVYADRGRFRSQAALNVGEPIEVLHWADQFDVDPEGAVRELTERIAEGMRAVTANFESKDQEALAYKAAAYALADEGAGYGRRYEVMRMLGCAFRAESDASGEAFRSLAAAVDAHNDDLLAIGVRRADAAPRLQPRLRREHRRNAAAALALTPAALIGMAGNAPVAAIVAAVSSRVRNDGWQATAKGVTAVLALPVVWAVEVAAVSRRCGRRWGAFVAIASPVGGLAWVAWWARWSRWRHDVWRRRTEREAPREFEAAVESRTEVCRLVDELVSTRP